jgi:hypothetical protein
MEQLNQFTIKHIEVRMASGNTGREVYTPLQDGGFHLKRWQTVKWMANG